MENDQLQLKYKPIKVCGICGDKALGYNFNAITCEACKAFFRRNALRTKDFKCPFDGNCKIDLVTRRFCQKCRLKKCFDIGMKKEWILSEEEKRVKRDKILENRRKKESLSNNGGSFNDYENGSSTQSSLMFQGQLNNALDNDRNVDCFSTNNDIMLSPSHQSISSTQSYTGSSCYSDNDSSNHQYPTNNHLHNNNNNHSHLNHLMDDHNHQHNTNNNLNNNKEFLNSLYFLKHRTPHSSTNNNHNPNNVHGLSRKFFPNLKESPTSTTSSSITAAAVTMSTKTQLPSSTTSTQFIPKTEMSSPTSELPSISPYSASSLVSISSTAFPCNIKNSTHHPKSSSLPLSMSSFQNDNSSQNNHEVSSSSSLKHDLESPPHTLTPAITMPLPPPPPPLPPTTSSFSNHNRNDSSLASPGWTTPSSTTSNGTVEISLMDPYLEAKPISKKSAVTTVNHNNNQIKQPLHNGHHHHHHHNPNNYLESSSSSSSSSSYQIIQPHMFKTEPIQEELIVRSPMATPVMIANRTGSSCSSSPNTTLNQQDHHNSLNHLQSMSTNHHYHNNHSHLHNNSKRLIQQNSDFDTLQHRVNNGGKIIDQCSVISSDESEVATVYSSYNGDKNFEDVSTMDLPILLSNCSTGADNIKHTNDQNGYSSDDEDIKNLFLQSNSLSNEKMSIKSSEENSFKMKDQHKNRNRNSNTTSLPISMLQFNLSTMAPVTMSKTYNYFENFRLEELSYACGHLQEWCHNGPIFYELIHRSEIYHVVERIIHRLISMANMITAFSELCETDQLSLLKYSIVEIMIFRSVQCFLPSKDAWIFNLEPNEKGTLLQFNTCKTQLSPTEFTDDIKNFMIGIPETCKNDRNLFDLVTMVILFNPKRNELKHKDLVKLEYLTYRHLLCKYVYINYCNNETKSSPSSSSSSTTTTTTTTNNNAIIEPASILNMIDRLQKINSQIKNIFPCRIIEEKFMIRARNRY